MKTYDNSGRCIGETNTSFVDGKVIHTNTQFDDRGNAVYQHVDISDRNTGKTSSSDIFGRILP